MVVVVAAEGLEQLQHDAEVQRHAQVPHHQLPARRALDAAVLVLPPEQVVHDHGQREEQVPQADESEGGPEEGQRRRGLRRLDVDRHGVGEAEQGAEDTSRPRRRRRAWLRARARARARSRARARARSRARARTFGQG